MKNTEQLENDRLIKTKPIGHVIQNRGHFETKTPYYDIKYDILGPNYRLVLINFLGSGMWVRYFTHNIVSTA